ncbi:putative transposase [Neorhizobium sp. 2083]|uniref:RNA-guided endonuclease InsQ/TnpB family protein n=1 Tax=Neorhizobium sp. 2083 TaxID=2817762 RepID=UPI00285FC408|nr:transposase [Neorhizobium sp. 2083]MDR6820755.1 putative transposase [Neorhizobium sp. 2083]
MLIAHKIALDPTNVQRTYFARAAGTARFVYNWALAEWKRQYLIGKDDPSSPLPTEISLRRQLNGMKRETFPWMFDVTKCATQEAIINLGLAFRAFFEKRGKYPRFKTRGKRDSFCAANEANKFRCDGRRIKLPVVGWVRMREEVRFKGKLKRVTVSREADRWFASIMVDIEDEKSVQQPLDAVGVDLKTTPFATLSDGTDVAGSKDHVALMKRLKRNSRALSRKLRGSKKAQKAKRRLARLQIRISNIRQDVLHKTTSKLTKSYRRVGISHSIVRAIARNHRLSGSIRDYSIVEFRRQLDYKARYYRTTIVIADEFFPSSEMCSRCGSVKTELALSQRLYHCDDCGYVARHNFNAARNLEHMAASFAVSVCGEKRFNAKHKPRVKRSR